MTVNFLQKYSIMLRTLWITFVISLRIICRAYSGRFSRENSNKLVRKWAKQVFNIVKIDFHIDNPHQLELKKNTPYIIMSNHASHYDIPLLFLSFPGTLRMVAKKELFQVPVWGHSLKVSEFVSVDRKNRQQAIQDLDNAKQKMQSGVTLWISPEGGRTRSGKLRHFKKGAFMLALQTDAVIIPVGLRNTRSVLPADTWSFQTKQKISVHIGKPIAASDYSLETREQLMQDVRQQILTLADVGSE